MRKSINVHLSKVKIGKSHNIVQTAPRCRTSLFHNNMSITKIPKMVIWKLTSSFSVAIFQFHFSIYIAKFRSVEIEWASEKLGMAWHKKYGIYFVRENVMNLMSLNAIQERFSLVAFRIPIIIIYQLYRDKWYSQLIRPG